ncbi:YlcI/YnfO family protein [Xenorhabdus stockiae]|uniref:YlcI/YnfO family protein n=1 Tax=Xenorhabdus stockiae TaxID=351614 RepID=UPI00406407CC
MATGNKNNKSDKKNIRFPHELIDGINASVEIEKANNPNVNFSSWVIDACEKKLKPMKRKTKASSEQ